MAKLLVSFWGRGKGIGDRYEILLRLLEIDIWQEGFAILNKGD
jgi:hypothetical protein